MPAPAEQHEEWLRLLRPDGPFIALPVLTETFPQGLDTVPDTTRARIRQAWAEVQEDPALLGHGWERLVLSELLGWKPGLREGATLPESLRAGAHTPHAVLFGPAAPGQDGPCPRVLFFRIGWGESLTRAKGDTPSLVDRAADLARWREVPIALLSNGREWALVHARPKEATTVAVFDADLWSEEPLLLRSFASLLHARRAALPPKDAAGQHSSSLAALFARSAELQSEVTDTLGRQVREAVALLVAELSRLDRESDGALLNGVRGKHVYESTVTVMMRLVFLLYAEEQRLLPAEDRLYADSYAVSTLYADLDAARHLYGDELGDRRAAAWPRLLALFAAIHGGCRHDQLRIPAYGGSLFDPARFPWLADGKVTDRVVYEILDALLVLRRTRAGGDEALSYKGLDVEQIGHVYEGLLEYACERALDPHVGVALGRDGRYEAVLPLAELEAWKAAGPDTLERELKEATGVTAVGQIRRALAMGAGADKGSGAGTVLAVTGELDAACGNDEQLATRVAPFTGLLDDDLRGMPKVFPAGSVVLVRAGDRRNTGTHYTPKELAEEVVSHTLAPLCFSPGPAEGAEPGVWRAKGADELLRLRVLDPAMGSGAFLVSTCRYLADRVVDAWLRDGLPEAVGQDVGRDDRDELLRVARRLVADQCLYGVDRDPMAVELAKLSLWLVTLAKGRPFSFLDHALRSGDSLVGVLDVEQIKALHLDAGARQLSDDVSRALDVTESLLSQAAELRQRIEATPVVDIRVVQDKAELLREAESLSGRLRLAADAVVGAALAAEGIDDEEAAELSGEENTGGKRGAAVFRSVKEDAKAEAYENRLAAVAGLVVRALEDDDPEAAEQARGMVDRWLTGPRAEPVRPLHWPLEFPEIMGVGGTTRGFDAVVGNPPFSGGQKLTGNLGRDYREYLVNRLGGGTRGSADLCAYFLLRNLSLAPGRRTGIIATNTIAQGDTREVGLDQATSAEWRIYRAIKSQKWPGTAALEVSLVWLGGHAGEQERLVLDEREVRGITPGLDPQSRVSGKPYRLAANAEESFIGSYVLGKGFILPPEQARALIEKDPRNKDVLFPYLNGEDLNSRPDCSASRWVINFHDWPLEKATTYEDVFAIVEREVKPVRATNPNRQRREFWWRFTRPTLDLYEAIADLDQVIVIALVSRTVMPARVPANQVLAHKLCAFTAQQASQLALLSSAVHSAWAWRYSSTMKADLNYSPSDVFETFPLPPENDRLMAAGNTLERAQRNAMAARNIGLTKLYNAVHDKSEQAADVAAVRAAHVEVDEAVAEAYGWGDLDMGHGFHPTRQGERFTIEPSIQTEVLDRLLLLNHVRYKEEQEAGSRTPKARKKAVPQQKARAEADPEEGIQGELFSSPGTNS
ncbi:Eco57I restriction-modification methylase domain-containing protein [Streptomyces armeniacus]|uniref:Eco57I restriction-modification methylase domain-containing protein n=1 Tax=Streptomyces armeniacus TaxID=83291 RepID=UPI001AD7E7C2|nr:type IIL restriction-modification enzyme MmeI [Streptomyces armeniacus]